MITITSVGDRLDRKLVTINQSDSENTSQWTVSLLTIDLPNMFVNNSNRKADLSIISGDGFVPSDHPNSILLPVTLIGISHMENETKYYYRQRYDSKGDLVPILDLNCFVTHNDAEPQDITNPHVLITLNASVVQDSDHQKFSGNSSDKAGLDLRRVTEQREHVDRGENANGGIDLPIGVDKNNDERKRREESGFVYENEKVTSDPV